MAAFFNWRARSNTTPVFARVGINTEQSPDSDIVQSLEAHDAAPTTTTHDRPVGSAVFVRGSDPGVWFRGVSTWLRFALQAATASFTTVTATTAVATNTVSERTSAAGVTVDGLKIKDGRLLTDEIVKAAFTNTSATGGATGATMAVQLYQGDGSTAITSARQVFIRLSATQYGETADSSPTFGSATAGSIIASGNGWALIETSAAGAFSCTVTNATDETLYCAALTPPGGVSDVAKSCVVLASPATSIAWAA